MQNLELKVDLQEANIKTTCKDAEIQNLKLRLTLLENSRSPNLRPQISSEITHSSDYFLPLSPAQYVHTQVRLCDMNPSTLFPTKFTPSEIYDQTLQSKISQFFTTCMENRVWQQNRTANLN